MSEALARYKDEFVGIEGQRLAAVSSHDHVPVAVDESHTEGGGTWEGHHLKQLHRIGVGDVDLELTTADEET